MHRPPRNRPPSGTVTFLFTDIEGSTKRWEQHPSAMRAALARHDALLREAIEAHGGYVFKTVGDAFCAAFPTAVDALSATLDAHRALQAEEWGETGPLRVRVGLHTGMAQERDGDYFGPALNRVARLQAAGHGQQTLLSQPTYELARDHLPAGVALQDMGEHRLKDLIRSEHIYQVLVPGLPTQFPPLKTLDDRPNNLPLQPTALIGREKEVEEVTARLLRDDVRLLTLTGPGGTGKTRLALQAAAEVIEHFRDGVFFINLAPITDPDLVVSEIAQTLGVQEAAGKPLVHSLKEHLHGKHLLLLLDNFEQIVPAASLVSQLTQSSPHLKVLVTSRIALRVRGEREYAVPPLGLPPDLKHLPSVERLSQYEAVRLFIERATDIKPAFEVTNENAPAVAEICYRLDGLPLSIELAAARIRILPPQAMLSRLQSRLKLLTGGGKDLPARQQTLRGAIEWSYELLDEGEKQLFRRLAVFVGGRTLEAIAAVCNAEDNAEGDTLAGSVQALQIDMLDGVESLVANSLLRQEEGVGGEPRFVMLETIHEYAREKLQESGEGEELGRRHAQYFLDLAEEAEPHLTGPHLREWLVRVEEELDNFRAALTWLLQRAKEPCAPRGAKGARGAETDSEEALRLSAALFDFWYGRNWDEGKRWLQEALANSSTQLTTPTSYRARTKVLRALRSVAWAQGDSERGRALSEELLRIAKEQGDKHEVAEALNTLGNAKSDIGDLEAALADWQESLALHRELGDKSGISRVLNNIGEAARQRGEYDQAIALYEESLSMAREIGDKRTTGICLNNLGLVLYKRGDYARAQTVLAEVLGVWRERSVPHGAAYPLMGLAGIAQVQGEPTRAARLLGAAQAMLEMSGAVLDTGARQDYERIVEAARAQLDGEAWRKASAEGQTMSMEEAIGYALGEPNNA
jgi:predicted ATPase/class 3 adenylate cyclase/Tfp pilus assembly protein PilF